MVIVLKHIFFNFKHEGEERTFLFLCFINIISQIMNLIKFITLAIEYFTTLSGKDGADADRYQGREVKNPPKI
jgi:hypothetical protein